MKNIFLALFVVLCGVSFSFGSDKATQQCIDKCLKDSKNFTKEDCNYMCSGVNVLKDKKREIRYGADGKSK